MRITNAHLVAYSPTGTTLKNISHISHGMGFSGPMITNLTPPQTRESVTISEDTVAIIGAPVYSGRVAPHAVKRLAQIKGSGGPAVVVAVYGNRHYDNALIELRDLAEKAGFVVVGGAALLGEHSFSSDEKPVAKGRPDEADLAEAKGFGEKVIKALEAADTLSSMGIPEIPGTVPEEPFPSLSGMCPEVDKDLCIECGVCALTCPVEAIAMSEGPVMDPKLCTYCLACQKACPSDAIRVTTPLILGFMDKLFENCKERREPEFFLSC